MPFFSVNGRNILFIHVPKTGGTTVEAWIEEISTVRFRSIGIPDVAKCTPQHFTMYDFQSLFGDGFFDYTFMIVRNPYTRLESEYRMRAAEARNGFWSEPPKFSQWLQNSLSCQKQDPWILDNHIRPQWEFLGTGVEVFKLEDGLENILETVSRRIGLSHRVPVARKMASDKMSFPVTWDRRDKLRVQKFYDLDFSEFGYKK